MNRNLLTMIGCLLSVSMCGQIAVRAESAAPAKWRDLIATAEPMYLKGDYAAVLPLYEQAVNSVSAEDGTPARIQCLRYFADCLCRLHQADKALEQYGQVDKLLSANDVDERITNLDDKAQCFGLNEDYEKAESLGRMAQKLCLDSSPPAFWQLARTQAQLGYFDYMKARYPSAIVLFQAAEHALDQSGRSNLMSLVLRQKMAFAQAGSYYHLRKFDEAYQQFKRLYEFDSKLFGKTDLQTGWAMMALSDVLEKVNKNDEAEKWYQKAVYVFRKFNRDRISREANVPDDFAGNIQQQITDYVFGNSKVPVDLQDTEKPLCADSRLLVATHDPRSLYARPFVDAPGRVWLNPLIKQRGLVIAIHGLSLEHSSYDAFATQLAEAGYCTVAFDVRGFGAYRQALGAEHIDFEGCRRDLRLVVKAIKADNPGKPLFILGESMGGAIALQFAAEHPELIDGLIASVPAGRRFNEKLTAVKVAIRYIEDKHRPFDIGKDVINQATHDPQVKRAWTDNPTTRSTLSPQELLAFQLMCNRNLEAAKRIQSTPVIIFQGVSDGLVKPEATYDLFRAIESKDKSLLMVGNAEHLIFEEGCFPTAVLKGLVGWMDSHLKPVPAK